MEYQESKCGEVVPVAVPAVLGLKRAKSEADYTLEAALARVSAGVARVGKTLDSVFTAVSPELYGKTGAAGAVARCTVEGKTVRDKAVAVWHSFEPVHGAKVAYEQTCKVGGSALEYDTSSVRNWYTLV